MNFSFLFDFVQIILTEAQRRIDRIEIHIEQNVLEMQTLLELVLDSTELVMKLVERTNVSQAHFAPFY